MREEDWVVGIRNGILSVISPTQKSVEIRFEKIKGIAIETNDSGPFGADIIWHVSDGKITIRFPMGARGEKEVVEELMKIDGFNYQEMIDAMGSVDNKVFIPLNRTEA